MLLVLSVLVTKLEARMKVARLAGQDLSAGGHNLWRVGELLAVENEHILGIMNVMMGVLALGLDFTDANRS